MYSLRFIFFRVDERRQVTACEEQRMCVCTFRSVTESRHGLYKHGTKHVYTCFGCANRPPEKVVNQLRKMLESEVHGVWGRQARQTSTYFC